MLRLGKAIDRGPRPVSDLRPLGALRRSQARPMTPVTPTTLLGLLSHVPDGQTAIIQPEQNIRT